MTPDEIALQANAGIPAGQAGSPWSNPTPATTESTPVTRYTTPAPSPTMTPPTLAVVDEKAIREQTRKRMQSSIDAINANYSNLISQEKVQAEDRSGQTRAMNARGGLIGSDFGAANQEKTTQYNKQQQQALIDQQNAQINNVMLNIEDRASAEIQNRKQEALGKYQLDQAAFDKAQAQAREDFKTLAASGTDLNSLNPAQKAALFKQSGYDPQFGELIYNAMKPKPAQIDYQSMNIGGGKVLFYGVDPQTGELKQQVLDVGLPDEWSMTVAPDGTVLGFNKNTGETRMMSGQGQFAKPESLKQSIVKVNGVDYMVDEQGNLTMPQVPQGQVSELKTRALTAAQQLLKDFQDNKGNVGLNRFSLAQHLPGTSQYSFDSNYDNLKSLLSLDNVRFLKGQGQVSDAERALLEKASSQLDIKKSATDFERALQDIIKSLSGSAAGGQIIEYNGHQYQADPQGNFDPNRPLTSAGSGANNAQKTLASAVITKFPAGSVGGQCGDFVRKVANSLGLTYPSLGDTLKSKTAAVQKYGTSLLNAAIGSVVVTKENPTYGHVAYIIGKNAQGWLVAESNYKQSNMVSYGRVIPYNSPLVIGVINPQTTA